MADPQSQDPPSPVSLLLQTLGMTRGDLMQHAENMKSFLQTEQNSLRAISNQTETVAPQSSNTRAASRSRNPSFSNNACAPPIRPASPPVTPVKTEPVERGIPRQMDTMELIMEQKDRQKRKERRESASRSKDTRRVELPEVESPSPPQTPVDTPHHYRYYSERVLDEASGSKTTPDPFILTNAYLETPTRKTPRARLPAFKAPQTPSRFPKTPSRPAHLYEPSSSRASTPMSSPARIVNLVSSPGPMRPVPQIEDSPEDLPYTVPPGPYPREKPDASYAAIIGQAIMASPDHRLALQDIYEWITTVYPYYQRGEQTWMNSVRHALSTMAVFRKVPRTRMEGKSLWAIFDQDVPCFADGGFRKSLCADMVKIKTESSKPGPKKRGTMEEAISRNAKRRKTSITGRDVYGNPVPPLMSGPVLQPFYSVLPGTHHQPYYGTYMPAQPLPAEVVFPPLPPSSNYSHLVAMKTASAVSSRSASVDASSVAPSSSYDSVPSSHEPSPAPSSSVTSSSVPELSPDDGASSSPPLPEVSNCDPQSANVFMDTQALEPEIADPDADFEKWLADPVEEAVAPHMTLLRGFSESKGSPEGLNASTARRRAGKMPALPVPTSPTLERRAAAKQKTSSTRALPNLTSLVSQRASSSREMLRPSTPPRRPCTPPRKRKASSSPQHSPQRTPVSHSRSRRKTPSPPHELPIASMLSPELMRTPSRKRVPSSSSGSAPRPGSGPGPGSGSANKSPHMPFSLSPFAPVTPKRMPLSGSNDWSPFRTPLSARRLFDPHDPATLLDDELTRLNNNQAQRGLQEESPSGLFGRAGKGLLYESPNPPASPDRWERYW